MARFDSIYPFTTENIAGYMKDLNLSDKKIITVTGSSDHIINAILKGCNSITTFDINPLTKYYMDLKLSAIQELTYEDFLKYFLYNDLDYNVVLKLNMPNISKEFWLDLLSTKEKLKETTLFNMKYFKQSDKLWQNLYLNKDSYNEVKERIDKVKIEFLNCELSKLELDKDYDYMFLSNISDYLKYMYKERRIEQYKELLLKFQKNVGIIYFAYLYDIGNINYRSEIDDLDKVRKIIGEYEKLQFRTALNEESEFKEDGVLILKRRDKNVRK